MKASSPTSWGESWTKESPALPIPSYPALCREDITSWNDGRPRTHPSRATKWITSYTHQLHGFIHVCQAQKYESSVIVYAYWFEGVSYHVLWMWCYELFLFIRGECLIMFLCVPWLKHTSALVKSLSIFACLGSGCPSPTRFTGVILMLTWLIFKNMCNS